MESEKAPKLAEHIANPLQESEREDFTSLPSSIEKINQRLDKIEFQIIHQNPQSVIPNPQPSHPSQQKFQIAEAVAQEIIEHLEMERACPYEPTGKPCDHCAMCNSRGF